MLEIHDQPSRELYPLDNDTLDNVLIHLARRDLPFSFVRHPYRTCTVDEKREMIKDNPGIYSLFKDITIVKGAALCYEGKDGSLKHVAHFNTGARRIDTKQIKKTLGIPRKRDLKFYDGNLLEIIGMEHGEVSPLMPTINDVDAVTFESELLDLSRERYGRNKFFVFDMALTQELSLYADISEAYGALEYIVRDKLHTV